MVAAVDAGRRTTTALFVLAALMSLATVLAADDRLRAIITVVVSAAIYAGMTFVILNRTATLPPPSLIAVDDLPPAKDSWTAVAEGAVVFVLLDAAVAWYALAQHPQEYFLVGIIAGVPAISLRGFLQAVRVEREFGGRYWVPSTFFRSKLRAGFVVRTTAGRNSD